MPLIGPFLAFTWMDPGIVSARWMTLWKERGKKKKKKELVALALNAMYLCIAESGTRELAAS